MKNKKLNVISKIFDSLEKVVLAKNSKYSEKELFDSLNINSKLSEIYLDYSKLPKTYVDIFIKKIKEFLKNPLFKDISLSNSKDLEFLGKSQEFKEYLDDIFDEIQIKLIDRKISLDKYFEPFNPKESISIQKIQNETKIDFASLMFILSFMLKNKDIYDFNGRSVTLN